MNIGQSPWGRERDIEDSSINQGGAPVDAIIRAMIVVLLCAFCALPARAGGDIAAEPERVRGGGWISELKIGALAHDVPYMWSGFNKERYGVDLNLEVLFAPYLTLWGGTIHPVIGGTANFNGDTGKAYFGSRWQWDYPSNWFFALGLAIAVHSGSDESYTIEPDRKLLGRRVLFHDSIEIGYRYDYHRSLSVYFEHISNASTASKNQGLDAIGLRYGYRF